MNKYNVIYLDVTLFISRAINIKDVVKNINYEVKTEIAKAFPQVEIGIDLAETLVHITEIYYDHLSDTKYQLPTAVGMKCRTIDEWDALFRELKEDTKIQKEYIDFLRGLFKSSWTDIIFEAAAV